MISLMAFGARFLNVTPWSCDKNISISAFLSPFPSDHYIVAETYSLVQVDGVLAGDNVGDGRTLGLWLLGGRHFCENDG